MTIYDIKYSLPKAFSENFFSRETLKFFNQTMRDFKVYQAIPRKDRFFHVQAPGRHRNMTYRLYDDKIKNFVLNIMDLKEGQDYVREHKDEA